MTVTADIPTDLVTPLGAYLRLRAQPGTRGAFLLESVERGRLGRYSFVGRGSRLVDLAAAETLGEPVAGYLGYDFVATLEPTVRLPDAGPDLAESCFVVPEVLVRFDHARGVAHVLAGAADDVAAELAGPQPQLPRGGGARGPLRRFPDREEHLRRVERAKEHIREGDVFQVVISQRAERPTSASALELYRALRRVNPSPYLFLLELDGLALVGSSPETVVKCEGARAAVNPIAGTIAPGEGDAEALLSSEKDRAEHVMLVDLGRNDLSRVCVPGSVRVERFMTPERYSHVTHLVSEVVGEKTGMPDALHARATAVRRRSAPQPGKSGASGSRSSRGGNPLCEDARACRRAAATRSRAVDRSARSPSPCYGAALSVESCDHAPHLLIEVCE